MGKTLCFLLLAGCLPVLILVINAVTNKLTSKLLFITGLSGLIVIHQLLFGNVTLPTLYFLVVVSTLALTSLGGLISVLFNLVFLINYFDFSMITIFNHLFYFIVIELIIGKLATEFKGRIIENRDLSLNLADQIKELRALRKISAILQGTLELDKVLHLILLAVTAGYGLEFNRAILFLVDEGQLVGKIGIGPLSRREGLKNWHRVAREKLNLDDMIEAQEEIKSTDIDLNQIIKELSFDLTKDHLATKVIEKQKCYNIKRIDPDDKFQCALAAKLGVRSFACVPLVVKGESIGILCVDNIVNDQEITYEDIDSLVPFANQAALAINNTRLHELKEEIAIKDNLTGLYNQRFFQKNLKNQIGKVEELGFKLGLLMIDIDHFKVYNDNNGHPAGNDVLAEVAYILQDSVRSDDIVCRFGGEEFAIILPDVSRPIVSKIANRIRHNVAEKEFEFEANQPQGSLTISVGGALFPHDADNERKLLDVADQALYTAKEAGRNQVKIY